MNRARLAGYNSLAEISEALGVHPSSLGRIIRTGTDNYYRPETGAPHWNSMSQKIADLFFCEPEEIFGKPPIPQDIKDGKKLWRLWATHSGTAIPPHNDPAYCETQNHRKNGETTLIKKELTPVITKLLSTLSAREAFIIVARFGLYGNEARTNDEIGDQLRITGVRVRQIENYALRKLRMNPQTDDIKSFLEIDFD